MKYILKGVKSIKLYNDKTDTELWWPCGLACQSIANSMLEVEGFIYSEIGLFQFSKCMLWTRPNFEFRSVVCTKYCIAK